MTTPPSPSVVLSIVGACQALTFFTAAHDDIAPSGLYNPDVYHKSVEAPTKNHLIEITQACWEYILTGDRYEMDQSISYIMSTFKDVLPFAKAAENDCEELEWTIEFARAKYALWIRTNNPDYLIQSFCFIAASYVCCEEMDF